MSFVLSLGVLAVHQGASCCSLLAVSCLLQIWVAAMGSTSLQMWVVAVESTSPACKRGCSRKRFSDGVRCDPKLASRSLALSCVSSARLIGLKKKIRVSCH